MSLIIQIVKMIIVCRQINLAIKDYINNVIARELLVFFVSVLLFLPVWLLMETGIVRLSLSIICSSFIIVVTVYYVGLTPKERIFLNANVLSWFKYKKKYG